MLALLKLQKGAGMVAASRVAFWAWVPLSMPPKREYIGKIRPPSPCWVIEGKEGDAAICDYNDRIAVFSSKKRAKNFLKIKLSRSRKFKVIRYSWDEFVKIYKEYYELAVIDTDGDSDFYAVIPLQAKEQ